jgi:hypothetical protein
MARDFASEVVGGQASDGQVGEERVIESEVRAFGELAVRQYVVLRLAL